MTHHSQLPWLRPPWINRPVRRVCTREADKKWKRKKKDDVCRVFTRFCCVHRPSQCPTCRCSELKWRPVCVCACVCVCAPELFYKCIGFYGLAKDLEKWATNQQYWQGSNRRTAPVMTIWEGCTSDILFSFKRQFHSQLLKGQRSMQMAIKLNSGWNKEYAHTKTHIFVCAYLECVGVCARVCVRA